MRDYGVNTGHATLDVKRVFQNGAAIGAFMGYAIGSLVGNQRNTDKGVHYVVTPRSVEANWLFR